jgi:CobQ-like glutamine amidotransferase family enzyme
VSRAADGIPDDVNIIVIGGGPDRAQSAISAELNRLAPAIVKRVEAGAALFAICGGYQNLGFSYRSALVGELPGPGIFQVSTDVAEGSRRLTGGCVVKLGARSPIAAAGRASAAAAGMAGEEETVVGFENHSGRTWLDGSAQTLGVVVRGSGNNDRDRTEGFLALPGPDGRPGLRLGTYLHGPLLPRNPHLADYILLSALGLSDVTELAPLDDAEEWAAHRAFAERWLRAAT